VLGLAACSGGSFSAPSSDGRGEAGPGETCGVAGSCPAVPLGDAGETQNVGIVPSPLPDTSDAGGGQPPPCGGGPCGSVALPPEAGTDVTDGGAVGPDSGPDAQVGPCGNSPCGIGPIPPDAGKRKAPDGGDDASTAEADSGHGPCGGEPCGVIILPDAGHL
jgi:hypothetical protein